MRYSPKTKMYAHQKQGVRFALAQFNQGLGVGFLFEPRTGKTKTTIDTLAILAQTKNRPRLTHVVIVCPNRVMGTWVEEIHRHSPLTTHITVWDAAARRKGAPQLNPYVDLNIVIVNFEAFSTPGRRLPSGRRSKTSGRDKHKTLLQSWTDNTVSACVIDEGHKIKNPQGKSSRKLVSLRSSFTYRFLLTGTPVTKAKRAHDIYMLWQWINPDRFRSWGRTFEEFRNHTGRWIAANGFPQWIGAREQGMHDMQIGLHQDALVIRRADCFDLPLQSTQMIPVKLTPKSAHHYDEMAREMVTRLENGEIAEAAIPLVVTLRLSQITSGHVGVAENIMVKGEPRRVTRAVRISTEKLDALEEFLKEEIIEREEKVVICARFRLDLNDIEALCTRLSIPTFSIRGGLTTAETDQARRDFTRSNGPAAIVVQPQAAALGIDLSSAARMVWYSLTDSWVNYTQTCDRIALSKQPTTISYLVVPGTVDDIVYQALQEDGEVSRKILTHPDALLRSTQKS